MVYAFDLDDTLYTEMDFVYSGYRVVARELDKDSDIDADIYFEGISSRRPVGFEWALDQYRRHGGKDVEMSVDKMIEIYRGHKPEIKLRPGIGRLLENLHREGHVLVLITDGSTRHQRSKIRALDIEKYFDKILISEETGGDKTTDIPWSIIEKSYAAPGQRFVYVGDNMSKDFLRPGLRGWLTVMSLDTAGVNVFPQNLSDWPPQNLPRYVVVI